MAWSEGRGEGQNGVMKWTVAKSILGAQHSHGSVKQKASRVALEKLEWHSRGTVEAGGHLLWGPGRTPSHSQVLRIERSYLSSTLYNTPLWTSHSTLKNMFCPYLDCNLEYKDQYLHGSWHTVPNTKHVFAEWPAEFQNEYLFAHTRRWDPQNKGCFTHQVSPALCIMSGTDGILINTDWTARINDVLMAISWGYFWDFIILWQWICVHFINFFSFTLSVKKGTNNHCLRLRKKCFTAELASKHRREFFLTV